MKIIYTIKNWAFTSALALIGNVVWAQAIAVDLQNVTVDGTSLCFDVYLSQGTGYSSGQSGGEWSAISLTFDLDVLTPTMGLSLDRTNVAFSMANNVILDANNLTAPNPPPGSVMGYETKGRISITNGTKKALPATPTFAFHVCYPILGGPVTNDATSDVQIRTSTLPTGSLWTNGTLFSRPLEPLEPQEPLPIELLTFEPRTNKCEVTLYWETASEKNLGYFQIEASKDGRVFKAIDQQKPESPNSSMLRAYKYVIPQPYHGFYFRLKAVDLDGASDYSPIVFTETPCAKNYSVQLYPNPNFLSELTVEVNSPEEREQVRFFLLDTFGKRIREQKTDLKEGVNKLQLPVDDLPSGTYFIQIIGVAQLHQPLKFVKSNF